MGKAKYFSQTVLFQTVILGKEYFMMQDVDGTIYLTRAMPRYAESIDGETGEVTRVVTGYEPKF